MFDTVKRGVLAVFPPVAMFNHSCEPNAQVSFVVHSAVPWEIRADVHTTRGVRCGDEVCCSYLADQLCVDTQARRDLLTKGRCIHASLQVNVCPFDAELKNPSACCMVSP